MVEDLGSGSTILKLDHRLTTGQLADVKVLKTSDENRIGFKNLIESNLLGK